MKALSFRSPLALAAACAVVTSSALHGQTVSIYTGLFTGSGTGFGPDDWSQADNWDTAFFPNAPDALAQFSQVVTTDRINMRMASLNPHRTAGILVLDGFALDRDPVPDNFVFRNVNTGGANFGTLQIHGFDTTINGDPARALVSNYSDQSISFSTVNASFQIQLAGSGHFHVEKPGVQTRVIVGVTEINGSHGIVKTGEGILHFGSASQNSNYTGGFTMREGIVEWTNSGGASANPFGTGPLTMQGGTFRSTSDGGRTLNSNIVLDGGATLGSNEVGNLGNVTVNSGGGNLETTIISDSTLTIFQTTNWHQSISGSFGLTKEGDGTLVFNGTGGNVTHTGGTDINSGRLMVNTSLTDSDLSVASGATLAFGTTTGVGQGIFGQTVTLASESILSFRLNALDSFDSMLANGPVTLNGSILDIDLGYAPDVNDVFLLIHNQSGTALSGLLTFGGSTLSEGSQFTVTTGSFSQLFSISYQHDGDSLALTAIPEPSTVALVGGLLTLGAVLIRRRRQ